MANFVLQTVNGSFLVFFVSGSGWRRNSCFHIPDYKKHDFLPG